MHRYTTLQGALLDGENETPGLSDTRNDSSADPQIDAQDDAQSSLSTAVSNSVHDLSPTLWHALDVWRCVKQQSGGQAEALRSLQSCGMSQPTENW